MMGSDGAAVMASQANYSLLSQLASLPAPLTNKSQPLQVYLYLYLPQKDTHCVLLEFKYTLFLLTPLKSHVHLLSCTADVFSRFAPRFGFGGR